VGAALGERARDGEALGEADGAMLGAPREGAAVGAVVAG
jgi:hypothetical protein